MNKLKLSKPQVKKIILNTLLLDDRNDRSTGKEGAAQVIEQLGYVQIDTINVIKRAHHHVLWTRVSNYSSESLHQLQACDRRVFEYWGRALSYVPMSDYRFYLPRMKNFENPTGKWAKQVLEKCGHLMEPFLERIRNEGPLTVSDFKQPSEFIGNPIWGGRAVKFALDYLCWRGDLMVAERRNFNKVYELTERILPTNIDTSYPTDNEIGQFLVRRALNAWGVAHQQEIQIYLQPGSTRDAQFNATTPQVVSKSLNDLMKLGEVIQIAVETDTETPYYALSTIAEKLEQHDQGTQHVHILSPFDHLVTQRDRTRRLFDYDYTLECYLPAKKRKFGFFALPILWGDQLIGKLDPKVDRKRNILTIQNIELDSNIKNMDLFFPKFIDRLKSFAVFNECTIIRTEAELPIAAKNILKNDIQVQLP